MKIWDEQAFADAYTRYDHDWAIKSNFGYHATTLQNLINRNDLTPAQEVLFVGCGFGYWMEYLLGINGVVEGNIWGVDTSQYITDNLTTVWQASEFPPEDQSNPLIGTRKYVSNTAGLSGTVDIGSKILDIDLNSPDVLNLLKPYYGGNGKINGWVLSSLVLTSLQTDQEISEFATMLEGLIGAQGKIGHIFASIDQTVNPETGEIESKSDETLGMNWQLREYWSARLPNHWLFDIQGGLTVWNPDTQSWSS